MASSSPPPPAGILPSLEQNLSLLLAALGENNKDDWADKPPQEQFRVYTPLTSAAPTPLLPAQPRQLHRTSLQAPPTTATSASTASRAASREMEEAEEATREPHGISDVSNTHKFDTEATRRKVDDTHGDARTSLDALMSEYVAALRGLRVVDASLTSPLRAAPHMGTTIGGEGREPRPRQAGMDLAPARDASVDTATLHEPLREEMDMQSLLDALDRLPPLSTQ